MMDADDRHDRVLVVLFSLMAAASAAFLLLTR